MTSTFLPLRAIATAMPATTEVLPLPPFCVATSTVSASTVIPVIVARHTVTCPRLATDRCTSVTVLRYTCPHTVTHRNICLYHFPSAHTVRQHHIVAYS